MKLTIGLVLCVLSCTLVSFEGSPYNSKKQKLTEEIVTVISLDAIPTEVDDYNITCKMIPERAIDNPRSPTNKVYFKTIDKSETVVMHIATDCH